MIDKFNFYDIYGYFLPGLAFLAVLWLPFGLATHTWPASSWGSAIIVLAVAYLMGHFLQTFGATGLESRTAPNNRFPSDAAFDAGAMPEKMRTMIAEIVQRRFGIDLLANQPVNEKIDIEEIDKVRNHAFFLARSVLNRQKSGSYAEQYQGMYALTRGLVVALAWGVAYWIGWAASIYRTRLALVLVTLGIVITLSLLISLAVLLSQDGINKIQKWRMQRLSLFVLMPLALFTAGYALGLRHQLTPSHSMSLLLAAAGGLFACFRFHSAYKSFAASFGTAIWHDFLALNAYLDDKRPAAGSAPDSSAAR
jgi:hypothetical protein